MGRPKLQSLLKGCCPRCRIGHVFRGNPYRIHKSRINEVCSHCGLRFEIEPGYFYAAFYVSYGFAVLELVLIGAILYFLSHSESPWFYLLFLAAGIVLLAPINFRLGRLILLYYLSPRIKYEPKYEDD